jgi:hypothetical protein
MRLLSRPEDASPSSVIDGKALGAGFATAAVSSLALAGVADRLSQSTKAGPTAATLHQAFLVTVGAGVGLAIGCAVAAGLTRRGRPVVDGLAAGAAAFLCVLVPAIIVTLPSDVSADEVPSTLVLAAILMSPFVLVGTALGATLRAPPRRRHEIGE